MAGASRAKEIKWLQQTNNVKSRAFANRKVIPLRFVDVRILFQILGAWKKVDTFCYMFITWILK